VEERDVHIIGERNYNMSIIFLKKGTQIEEALDEKMREKPD
jgi:hypothetical protein